MSELRSRQTASFRYRVELAAGVTIADLNRLLNDGYAILAIIVGTEKIDTGRVWGK